MYTVCVDASNNSLARSCQYHRDNASSQWHSCASLVFIHCTVLENGLSFQFPSSSYINASASWLVPAVYSDLTFRLCPQAQVVYSYTINHSKLSEEGHYYKYAQVLHVYIASQSCHGHWAQDCLKHTVLNPGWNIYTGTPLTILLDPEQDSHCSITVWGCTLKLKYVLN